MVEKHYGLDGCDTREFICISFDMIISINSDIQEQEGRSVVHEGEVVISDVLVALA